MQKYSKKIQQDETEFSCGILDEGSGGERLSRFLRDFVLDDTT
jgi:hypothetical protein